jgi:Calcineurin-like phosphoesterase
MSRVLILPRQGVLLAATDLHGHLRDFRAVVARFQELGDNGVDPQLMFCGDLVHGPSIGEDAWPEHLGTYYEDQSRELLDEAAHLERTFRGRVHYLLGNHEHAHLGGPRLDKFHPDEAAHLENRYGVGEFEPVRRWIAGWPWVAVAPAAGLVLTHAAPHAQITSPADLDAVRLDGYEHVALHDMAAAGPLGALLWARTTTSERAHSCLHALDPGARVAVFGHDPVREGHLIEHEPLLCLSTSFGCHDGDKVFLSSGISPFPPSAPTTWPGRGCARFTRVSLPATGPHAEPGVRGF